MTWMPDLGVYRHRYPCLRSVGWLHPHGFFPQGPVPREFVEKLLLLVAEEQILTMRGYHVCDWCEHLPHKQADAPEGEEYILPRATYVTVGEGEKRERVLLGNAEIMVPGLRGVYYMAPTLIYHYVQAHQYQPPDEFVESVLAFDPSSRFNGQHMLDYLYRRERTRYSAGYLI
jgi:hypothetical protein